ncbi:two-component system sensor histidine kinase DesK [Arthrobacter sp. CAN_A212]|uniref:sensor histidine kinase n=1 Tax=Arthrobacter sp. CAN_A212 TaxID=2787719 RepID=UPI0018CA9C0D
MPATDSIPQETRAVGAPAARLQALQTYTWVSLMALTIISAFQGLFDVPFDRPESLIHLLLLAAVLIQQSAILAHHGHLPSRGWSCYWLPRQLTSLPVTGLFFLAGIALLSAGGLRGGPVWLWALPASVTAANAVLVQVHTEAGFHVGLHARIISVLAGVSITTTAGLSAEQFQSGTWPSAALLAAGVVVVAFTVQVGQVWWQRVLVDLDEAKGVSVELAVAQERLRFAGDLHDIQGHQLQAIAIQADLARNMLDVHGADSLAEVRACQDQIHALASTALKDTRAIAHGYRKVSIETEVSNAVDVLAAAGMTLTIVGPVHELTGEFAHHASYFVRESTTNLLRHSLATSAILRVVRSGESITCIFEDPGPERAPHDKITDQRGFGLEQLADRARKAGFALWFGQHDGGWRLELTNATTKGRRTP